MNCGIVNAIDSRMNTLVSKLDQPDADQKPDAACSIATGIVDQREEFVNQGRVDPIVTHPPQAGAEGGREHRIHSFDVLYERRSLIGRSRRVKRVAHPPM